MTYQGSEPRDAATGRLTGTAVLFDIDDTLVDLVLAMGRTLREIPDPALSRLSDADWIRYIELYTADPRRHYERFLLGEVTFQEQRVHRIRHARAEFTDEPFSGAVVDTWVSAYEQTLPRHFAMFDDVGPLLDELDALGVPYGAVSNNVHAYQRAKLDRAGLERIEVLVGIDTVGVAKPDPAIYLEGVRLLGADPARTVYVGDNRELDAVGATNAGLIGVWLDRSDNRPGEVLGDSSDTGQGVSSGPDGGQDVDAAEPVPTISGLVAVLQFLPSVR